MCVTLLAHTRNGTFAGRDKRTGGSPRCRGPGRAPALLRSSTPSPLAGRPDAGAGRQRSGGGPDPLAPSRLNPTSACQERMKSGDLLPVSGRNPIPARPARNRHRSVPRMHVCKLFSGVSNAEAESYDAWSQRALKAKRGGKKKPLSVVSPGPSQAPTGAAQGKGWDAEMGTLSPTALLGGSGREVRPRSASPGPIPTLRSQLQFLDGGAAGGPQPVWGQHLPLGTVLVRDGAVGPGWCTAGHQHVPTPQGHCSHGLWCVQEGCSARVPPAHLLQAPQHPALLAAGSLAAHCPAPGRSRRG